MALSDARSNIDQNINGDVPILKTAQGNFNEIHNYHPPPPTNNDDKDKQTNVSLELRCIGLKITGLNPWHTGILIGGGIALSGITIGGVFYLSCQSLSLIEKVIGIFGLLIKARFGCLELLVFTKDKKSKQKLMEDLLSNTITAKVKSIVGVVDEQIRVEPTCVGAVIATNEEFSKLQKHLKAKQKKLQWKINNDCKGSLVDICCTLPIFQNISRMMVEYISPKDASDYLECVMQSCEFDVSQTECHLNKRGFLTKHTSFVDFTKTQQSHPALQNRVIRIVKSLTENETIMSKLLKISDLLAINPRHFPGDCEWLLRKLSKITKGLIFEQQFEFAKDLLVWMIRLLHNLAPDKNVPWFWFLLKLRYWFVSRFKVNVVYDDELHVEIRCQAVAIFKEKYFHIQNLLFRLTLDCENLINSITFLLEQKSKSALTLAAYFTKQLIFMREFQQNLCFHSEISKFVSAIRHCNNLSRDRPLKFVIDGLNSLISESLLFKIKLDILEEARYLFLSSLTIKQPLIDYYHSEYLLEWFSFYERSFFSATNSLLECSKQSHKSSIKKKSFSISSRQNCFDKLQVCLLKFFRFSDIFYLQFENKP